MPLHIGDPVVRTYGRSRDYYVTTKISWLDSYQCLTQVEWAVVISSICCADDHGHRDVTTSEARDFAEFSKMALAKLLDTRSTNSFFVLDRLSAVFVFLWNRNLGSLFRYR